MFDLYDFEHIVSVALGSGIIFTKFDLRKLIRAEIIAFFDAIIIILYYYTRNLSGDEIANVNFRNDDSIHALQNTIDSCIHAASDRYLQRRFTKFSEITQCNGAYAVQGHSRSPILVPIESSCTTSYK